MDKNREMKAQPPPPMQINIAMLCTIQNLCKCKDAQWDHSNKISP